MKKTYFFYYDDDIIDGLDIPEEEIFKAKILLVKNVVFGRTNRLQELILNSMISREKITSSTSMFLKIQRRIFLLN